MTSNKCIIRHSLHEQIQDITSRYHLGFSVMGYKHAIEFAEGILKQSEDFAICFNPGKRCSFTASSLKHGINHIKINEDPS